MNQIECRELQLEILNPKNGSDVYTERDRKIFPYYAGYASAFADRLLASLNLPSEALIVDPWNGSGTSLLAAARRGHVAIGYDLNPVMVLASKASLVCCNYFDLTENVNQVLRHSENIGTRCDADDPLCAWLSPSSVTYIREIDQSINKLCFSTDDYIPLLDRESLSQVMPIHAFLYVCLFRVTRKILSDFIPSNPTWVKRPANKAVRKRPSRQKIRTMFLLEVDLLSASLPSANLQYINLSKVNANLGNSRCLELGNETVDFVLTSPPYCTRIDYAVATSIELAVLRCDKKEFVRIRRSLVGNSMIDPIVPKPKSEWGESCNRFLADLFSHSSQASGTYYYKNHLQYFDGLYDSLTELARVLRHRASAVLVVQDSFYKDLHNDVAQAIIEMGRRLGLYVIRRQDFSKTNSLSVINTKARKYRSRRDTKESVLVFQKLA